ncbi:MAG: hypothetical protein A3F54_00895 [Candidatus Kerfeldbacteria bacterium RIFCSPHIGHO2_12_FULL_48_17]|uniref:Carbonic anhydrase n=1 Tax=Candidatus Kerfeldbacteria bacterium RIFCSPHIGHO2_12_FULL_48_17 TaxID=1798542 RepID=A0A1G2B4I9_9BACT|nr:MAG: hypothetical protein A3F54_00895 [Candidatus Kerfeldbacteria bacterium RIFCSPHIGHO2_12_FULL_48_17]
MPDAKATILHCMDFRLEKAIDTFIDDNGYAGSADIISLAGAAKTLANPADKAELATVLREINLSEKLHHVHDCILINHTDCGAYGGRKAFASGEAEYAAHARDLQKAQDILNHTYPKLNVRKILAKIDDQKHVTFVEVE